MLGFLAGVALLFVVALVGGGTLAWASQLIGRWLDLSPLLVVVGAVGIFLGLAVHFAADHVLTSLRKEVEAAATWLAGRADKDDGDSDDDVDDDDDRASVART